MSDRKTKLGAVLAAVAMLLMTVALSACGGDDNGDSGEPSGAADGGEPSGSISVSSWGGSWTEAEEEFIGNPFTEETGIDVNYVVTGESPSAPAILQGESGNVRLDVIDTENTEILRQRDLLATFPPDLQELIEENSRPGTYTDDSLTFGTTANVIVCNPNVMESCPTNAEEFWDTENFPGPRAIFDQAEGAMAYALQADGVERDEVYPMDIDRAIAKLEEIKPEIRVWPGSGDEQQQVLINEEVGAAIMWNGRAFVVKRDNIPDLELHWEGATLSTSASVVVMEDAPNIDAAFRYIQWIVENPEAQAQWSEAMNYLTSTDQLMDLVSPEVAEALPTAHEDVLVIEDDLWLVENAPEIEQAWQQLLAG